MFDAYFLKRKIRKYAKTLPLELRSSFGKRKYYSKSQVDTAIVRRKVGSSGVAVADNCYAYAMFCSPKEFKQIHDEAGEVCDYQSMREEISSVVFGSTSDFSTSSLCAEAGSGFFDGSGGGFDGGGGGSD